MKVAVLFENNDSISTKKIALDLQQALLDSEDISELTVKLKPVGRDIQLDIKGEWTDEVWMVTHDGEIVEIGPYGAERHLSYDIDRAIKKAYPGMMLQKLKNAIDDKGYDVRIAGGPTHASVIVKFKSSSCEIMWHGGLQKMEVFYRRRPRSAAKSRCQAASLTCGATASKHGTHHCSTIAEVIEFLERL